MFKVRKHKRGRLFVGIIAGFVCMLIGAILWLPTGDHRPIAVPPAAEGIARLEALRPPPRPVNEPQETTVPLSTVPEWVAADRPFSPVTLDCSLGTRFALYDLTTAPEQQKTWDVGTQRRIYEAWENGEPLYADFHPRHEFGEAQPQGWFGVYWGPDLFPALARTRMGGTDKAAIDLFIESLRELQRYLTDPQKISGFDQFRIELWSTDYGFLQQAHELLSTADGETLAYAASRIKRVAAATPWPSDTQALIFQAYDRSPPKTPPMLDLSDAPDDNLGEKAYAFYTRIRAQRRFAEAKDEVRRLYRPFLEAMNSDWPTYEAWREDAAGFLDGAAVIGIGDDIRSVKFAYTFFEQMMSVLETMVALERLERDQSHYPKALAALVPRYLATRPLNPFTLKPFSYQRQFDSYHLETESYRFGLRPVFFSHSPLPAEVLLPPAGAANELGPETLPPPKPEAMLRQWLLLGPFDSENEPCPKDLLQWCAEGVGAVELASRTGATCHAVTAENEEGVVSIGDRFDLPRTQIYYLLSTIQATRAGKHRLRFGADTTAHLWCGVDATEVVLKGDIPTADTDYISDTSPTFERDFPWSVVPGNGFYSSSQLHDEVLLAEGVNPVLVRFRNFFGKSGITVAVQDADGRLPASLRLGE